MITRQHSGAPGFSMFTSARSNRSLAQWDDDSLPGESDIDSGFDACGNQQELQRGQAMDWDIRNQLSRVTLVKRETEPDDYESYRYDRPGHRLRKVGFAQSSGRTLRTEVRYLPGLEIHRQADGEEHHVISVEAGRSNMRALHWPQGEHSDQLRYSLSDHLGSSTLELDDEAGVLTQEHYYPFGGTACWAGKSALVAQYKTIRYSGKERDATGLYYYGYRYYAPWLQCWINPDPAGSVNGLNFFNFVGGKPVNVKDIDGRFYEGEDDVIEVMYILSGNQIVARGLDDFSSDQVGIIKSELSEVERIYSGAQSSINIGYTENSNILRRYFGSGYEKITSSIVESFWRGENLSRDYQGAWGGSKFLGLVMGDSASSAQVNVMDFHGRIAINVNRIESGSLRTTLGHEVLHLGRVNRLTSVGPRLNDYFYVTADEQGHLGVPISPHGSFRESSEIIMSGGLTAAYIESFGGIDESFVSGVEDYYNQVGNGMDLNLAVSLFNSDPDLRATMASRNADSVIMAAEDLYELHRARHQDSQLFYNEFL